MPRDPILWMLVFLRVSAMLTVFPVFSAPNVPVQVRVALGALVTMLVAATVPPLAAAPGEFLGMVGLMAGEVGIGLLLGFLSRIVFYGLEAAGNVVATHMGLMMSTDVNPFSDARSDAPSLILYFLGVTLFLSLDLHHWLLFAMQRSYALLPVGGGHLSEWLVDDFVRRTSGIFVVAVLIGAPMMAVAFIVTLIFSVLGRAVPQMNVFAESFSFRILSGLIVLGSTLSLSAQHISNYLRNIPEDILRVAQWMGAA